MSDIKNQPLTAPSSAVAALFANIVEDPCALSLGKPEISVRGVRPFCDTPQIGDGTIRHQEQLLTKRRQAGSY